jgi:hypothetical protein
MPTRRRRCFRSSRVAALAEGDLEGGNVNVVSAVEPGFEIVRSLVLDGDDIYWVAVS